MDKRFLNIAAAILIVIGVISQCVFTVDQRQQAIILQLGEPVKQTLGPGLHFKLPFIQNVIYFDSRVLSYDFNSPAALTKDTKSLVLDNYVRWRIADPLLFYTSLHSVSRAPDALRQIVYAQLHATLAQYEFSDVISSGRAEIMEAVKSKSNDLSKAYGIEIIDVRIKRADLQEANQKAVFKRMQAERERQAKQYRSEGVEEATKIRSAADRDRVILLAEAKQKAQLVMGGADAEAVRIMAEAIGKSPDFYEFSRSLQAYRKSLQNNTKLMLDPDMDFLKHME